MNLLALQPLITNPVLIFFIVLVIILFAPILLNKIKIPHIIGMIVAGVVVGPHGFNLLARDSSFEIFGQVGLLYLMFLAGLEIDMFHLKKNINKGFVFGIYTTFIPIAIGMIASVYILNVSWTTSLLLASMYASHTLIAYPVVSRFEITKSPVVLIAIVGTIFAVLGALLTLAIGVGIHRDGGFSILFLLRLFGYLAVYCLAILYIYPRVTRWFFKNYNDSVSQFVFVLALVFLAAWLAQVIGLEAVLGAFFAGLVLNRYIPNVSPLMSRIEFVGNALFIPYFLIGVGMLINLSVLSDLDTVWVTVNMIGIALLVKWLAAWAAQKTYHMEPCDRNLMFGLTTAHTAVALAVVMIGYNITLPDGTHLLNENILNATIVMILITCGISSFITEQAATKIKIRMVSELLKQDTNDTEKDNILIPVSNPITTPRLVELALMMRGAKRNHPIYALHVRNEDTPTSVAIAQNTLNLAEKAAAAVDARIEPIERYDLNTVTGIVNAIMERHISEIILGMHQRTNLVDSFYGSKIDQLLKRTNKMVVVSRCFIPLNTITRIIIAVPAKAEFETGFKEWIIRVGNITKQIGCRAIFCAHPDTLPLIKGVIHTSNLDIRSEYKEIDEWGDFILMSNKILDDDLLVMIGARRTSISFNSEMDNIPLFLSKYFSLNNILMVFPEQFGETPQLTSFIDPLASDLNASPSEVWIKLREWYKWVITQKKRITHPNRDPKKNIDI